ncbi:MAG: transcription antitermination factor NusB [Spartobacteria bacterium]|nr:transcription antitermination factor NusB [Spartobacteria bacterium]
MKPRRIARERAVQFLFLREFNKTEETADLLLTFWEQSGPQSKQQLAFTEDLVYGVIKNIDELDGEIARCATNWNIQRLALVDLNILRLGIYELLYSKDTPAVVVINEAVEVAKALSNFESGRFVNGILDRVRKDLVKKNEEA